MKNINLNKIFSESDCISEKILLDYRDNKLSNKSKYIVEKHLANCEICSDALEGLSLINNRSRIKSSIRRINSAIDKHTFHKSPKTISLNLPTKLAIAATIAILIGLSFLFTHYLRNSKQKFIAENSISEDIKEKNTELPVTISDSENVKSKISENKNYSRTPPSQNENFTKTDEKVDINYYIMPEKIDQSNVKTEGEKEKDVVAPKTKVALENDNLINKVEDKSAPQSEIVNEEMDNLQLNTKTLSAGKNIKDTEIMDDVEYKKQDKRKEKLFKINELVTIKRSENKTSNAPSTTGQSVIENETFNLALEKYNNKEYNTAKTLFEQILINDKSNYHALFYKSLCLFYLEDYEKSLPGFNEILKIENNEYIDSAKWFKSLVLIKNGNLQEAKNILEEIIKSNSPFKKDAELKLKEF